MEKPKFDIENFISDSKDILKELLENKVEVIPEGTIEDLLKLPMNDNYKNNQDRINRESENKKTIIELKSHIVL
jgi:hypothetical protein